MTTGLPDVADAKAYLRATDSGAEDTLIQQLLDRAYGAVQRYLCRPIQTRQQTFVIEGRSRVPARVLDVGASPIDTTQPITIVDGNNVTLATTSYRADAELGLIYRAVAPASASFGLCWAAWPYTVTLTWGLSARVDWTDTVAPAVGGAILDVAADLFQRRAPAASAESAGGGVSASWAGGRYGLPTRVCAVLDPFRMVTG